MKDITVFLNEQLQATEDNKNNLNEAKVESEKDFREYAEKILKEAHGDDYDADKAKEMIDGILEEHKDLVDENKWGEIVGIFNNGLAKED